MCFLLIGSSDMEERDSYYCTSWCIGTTDHFYHSADSYWKPLIIRFSFSSVHCAIMLSCLVVNMNALYLPISYQLRRQVYTGSFSLGMGGIPWVIMSEVNILLARILQLSQCFKPINSSLSNAAISGIPNKYEGLSWQPGDTG